MNCILELLQGRRGCGGCNSNDLRVRSHVPAVLDAFRVYSSLRPPLPKMISTLLRGNSPIRHYQKQRSKFRLPQALPEGQAMLLQGTLN